jgi:hypothetical protein
MRYINDFDTIDDSTDEPLVIHRHGSSPGRALIVLLHGLGGKRYGTWTGQGQDPVKVGLAKFLYEDIQGTDVGLYAYRTLLGRLKFWKSIPLKREAEVLADRIRDQSRVYKTVILAGHSMGGILAKAAVCELIKRDDVVTLAAIRALMLLATPQAGSLRVPKFVWNLTEDGRVLRAHGDLVTEIQKLFTDRIVAHPNPANPKSLVIPAYVVAAAEDNWVDEFSAGLNVQSERTNNIRASHTSAVKPKTKTDDAYEWLRDRIREVVQASASHSPSGDQDAQAAMQSDLIQVLQSAFTHDALKLHVTQLGIQLASIVTQTDTAHRALVEWAISNGRLRAVVRMMAEERPSDAGVQSFAEKHPGFGALLTSDERDLLRQYLESSMTNYAALRLFAIEAILLDLNDFFLSVPDGSANAAPYVPVLIRTADFIGQVEAVVGLILKRFPGPIVDGKLRPLLDTLRTRRAKAGPSESPFDACDLQGKLFINRSTFRDALRDLTSDKGATRVVAINGPSRSGKSHSKFLIEYLERLGRYDKALISLEDDTPGTYTPELLISTIVKRTGGDEKDLNLTKTRGETRDRWIKRLGDELLNHVNRRARAIFIVLDGFDQPSLLTDTRDLVQELLKRAATEARLRMALLGYKKELLPQEVSGRVAAEPIAGFTEDDLRRFFMQYARDQGKAYPTKAVLDVLVQQVCAAVPQNQPEPERNEDVAKAVEVWAERLRGLQ